MKNHYCARVVVGLLAFLELTVACYALEAPIMEGGISRRNGDVKARLYYGFENHEWGYPSYYFRLVIENGTDFPIVLTPSIDKYYFKTDEGEIQTVDIDQGRYPSFVNPGSTEKIFFTAYSFELLLLYLGYIQTFSLQVDRERASIVLKPVGGKIDLEALKRKIRPGVSFLSESNVTVTAPVRAYDYSNVRVTEVIDGDTLRLDNAQIVCLIGVEAPEFLPTNKLYQDISKTQMSIDNVLSLGQRAYDFVDRLCGQKTVRLEFDKEQKDKYGRLLAYVYLSNGAFVNAEIISQGYAIPSSSKTNTRHAALFKKMYQQAKKQGKGLWEKKR